jgi:uncharacterized RDD family membrane protein YckC
VGVWAFDPLFAKNEEGDLTRNAMIVATAVIVALLSGYVVVCEILGRTFGKSLTAIHVVNARTWARPGVIRGLVRTVASIVTVGSLGIGYVLLRFDAQRRALHDAFSGTVVIED